MHHLLAGLLNHRDLPNLVQVAVLAAFGSLAATTLLGARLQAWPILLRSQLFGAVTAATSWFAFRCALGGSYPQLVLSVPLSWAVPAVLIAWTAGSAAALIRLRGARNARNAMLAGSITASGASCMLLIGMAGLVQPFFLSYDLGAVLITMLIGSALWSFSLWETGLARRRHAPTVAVILICLAITLITVGSIAAILPLEDWITAVERPDDLTTAPVFIVLAVESGAVLALSLFGSLVDNRVAARDRLEAERLRDLANSTFEGIVIHRGGVILEGNERLADLIGLPLSDLCGQPIARFIGGDALAAAGSAACERDLTTDRGSVLPVEMLSRRIHFRGEPAVVSALRDVRERKASEKRIRFMAHHDGLTRLPNRVSLQEWLGSALQAAASTGPDIAVLCLDLDGFKRVNDTLGHGAGDQLLVQVADRLSDTCGTGNFIARIGGDEFVVVHPVAGVSSMIDLAVGIIGRLNDSFTLDGHIVSVGTSIGIARYPEHGLTSEALLKNADVALYASKNNGRGCYSVFEPSIEKIVNRKQSIEASLALALENGDMELYYQPIRNGGGSIVGCEALARWHHRELGTVPPSEFIPIAEKSGLIVRLGKWVIETACAAAATWPDECRVAVNVSPVQILRGNLFCVVESALRNSGLAPDRLEIEITENIFLDNIESSREILNRLRALGVKIALDDFGTGYSSLAYIHQFPLDRIKIDRSFVQRLEINLNARAIVKAIVLLGRDLNLAITAEGVETEAQFLLLKVNGCVEFQGYLFDLPSPLQKIEFFPTADLRSGAIKAHSPVSFCPASQCIK